MEDSPTFYVYQNGIVLGEFTMTAIRTGLSHGTFTKHDWVWASSFNEWQPLGSLFGIFPTEQKSEGDKGDTRVLPNLQLRPAAKGTNKNMLSRSMRLKARTP